MSFCALCGLETEAEGARLCDSCRAAVDASKVVQKEAETETLRARVAQLEAILEEIAPEFMLATEERPKADPRYVGARWAKTAANWMLKPKFAAYLKERETRA